MLEYIPIVDLLIDIYKGTQPESTGDLIWSVSQFLGGMGVVLKGAGWVASKTETTRDDEIVKQATGFVAKAIEWVGRLSIGSSPKK